MIDDNEITRLSKLHPRNKKPACIVNGDVAIVHSQWFVLELPKDDVTAENEWPGDTLEFIRQWKYEQLPQEGEGEVAQPIRITYEDEPVIQLMSENLEGFVDTELYDFVRRHVENIEFRLYPGKRPDGSPRNVGVFSKRKPVGVLAQLVKDEDQEKHNWKISL